MRLHQSLAVLRHKIDSDDAATRDDIRTYVAGFAAAIIFDGMR